ncbi:LysR family transcriptional regulator [Agarivorans sp. QJM3NY_25]|uniref:LysR family transcriptional regulator n=1 Tax=Agarivorans sp. QJM3NY_25 TaxID=3421430 RepID=UPI003D7C9C6E
MTEFPPSARSEDALKQIDLNLLRVFDVLMQERSVTLAAARLNRTQPAISHSLARLRLLLDDELFSRESRALLPTPRAMELWPAISQAISQIRAAIDQHLQFNPSKTQRNFRIGVNDYTAVTFLPGLIEAFSIEAPNASLNAIHERENDAASSLRNKQVDGIIIGNSTMKDGMFRVVELARDKMVCAGWAGNEKLDHLNLEGYLSAQHLQISADGISPGLADNALKNMGKSRNIVATVPHYLVAPWVIKGSDLLTTFGDGILPVLSQESEIRILPPPISLPDVTLSLIYEHEMENDLGHIWFRSLLRSVVEKQREGKQAAYRRFKL